MVAVREADHAATEGADQVARTRELAPIAFHLERIGLISLRFPYVTLVILIALAIAAAFGVERLKVDDSLSQLFRTNTPEFRQYEEVTRRFPSSEYDVLVVVEGKTLLERNSIDKLRDVVTDLQLIDGTRGLIVLALDPTIVQTATLNETVGEIRKVVAEDLASTGLKGELSGVPVMQLEIRNAVERDRIVYNAVGFIAGCAIAIAL